MKRITRKLSGPAKQRFLERFVAAEPGLDPTIAGRLAARCDSTFTSLRIRKSTVMSPRRRSALATAVAPAAPTVPEPASASGFDPYVFGLVPVFQREGRDGLIGRLAAISRIEDLRQMAKTQQIVLPAEMRQGPADARSLRVAIADAVDKRIADRRAAAG